MAKPTSLPRWATGGGALLTEPTSGEKDAGWAVAQKPPAQYMNWLQKWTYSWLAYLDTLEAEALTWTALQTFVGRLVSTGTTTNPGGEFTGGPTNGAGVKGTGVGTNSGGFFTGGASSGSGASMIGGLPNGVGGWGDGKGTGAGLKGVGQAGTTGPGGEFIGGTGGGHGAVVTGGGAISDGLRATLAASSGSSVAAVHGIAAGAGYAGLFNANSNSALVATGAANVEAVWFTAGANAPALLLSDQGADDTKSLLKVDGYIDFVDAGNPLSTDFLQDVLTKKSFDKAWAHVNLGNSSTPAGTDVLPAGDGINVASVVTQVGKVVVTFAAAMASPQYGVTWAFTTAATGIPGQCGIASKTVNGFELKLFDAAGLGVDPTATANQMSLTFRVIGPQ